MRGRSCPASCATRYTDRSTYTGPGGRARSRASGVSRPLAFAFEVPFARPALNRNYIKLIRLKSDAVVRYCLSFRFNAPTGRPLSSQMRRMQVSSAIIKRNNILYRHVRCDQGFVSFLLRPHEFARQAAPVSSLNLTAAGQSCRGSFLGLDATRPGSVVQCAIFSLRTLPIFLGQQDRWISFSVGRFSIRNGRL